MASISLWPWDEYHIRRRYPCNYMLKLSHSVLFFNSILCLTASRNQWKLRRMARFVCQVSVVRQQRNLIVSNAPSSTLSMESQSSTLSVLGGVVEISRGITVPCDMLLLKGSVVVNESMLTSESLRVVKKPLPMIAVSGKQDNSSIHQVCF